ncbi:MAG: hypothetical protein Q9178_005673 [Gyalolechia marmorata]
MQLPSLLLPLLALPLTLATTLTLTLPTALPPLSPSTRAHLTTHNHHLTAPLTLARTFRFTNLTIPGTYNLDVYSRDYDFEGLVVIIKETPPKASKEQQQQNPVEIYRRNLKTGGKGSRMAEAGENGDKRVEIRVRGLRGYYEERQGFELMGLLKSPMILMALVGLGMVFGMPYLLENMDPEMKKEFEEQQKSSVVGNVAGGGNPLSGFDMAGWMAGQTSGGGVTTTARENEDERGAGGGGGQGQGKGKGRRRG